MPLRRSACELFRLAFARSSFSRSLAFLLRLRLAGLLLALRLLGVRFWWEALKQVTGLRDLVERRAPILDTVFGHVQVDERCLKIAMSQKLLEPD